MAGRDFLRPWRVLSTRHTFEDEWLLLRSEEVMLPNGTVLSPYHTIEVSDSVNVVAVTEERMVLFVEQYRHPIGKVQLEIPAGHISAGEVPETAARRELLEETGFSGGSWTPLGTLHPFSSRLKCVVHSFFAHNVVQEREPQFDAGEHLSLVEQALPDFVEGLRSGRALLTEATQLAAAYLALPILAARIGF